MAYCRSFPTYPDACTAILQAVVPGMVTARALLLCSLACTLSFDQFPCTEVSLSNSYVWCSSYSFAVARGVIVLSSLYPCGSLSRNRQLFLHDAAATCGCSLPALQSGNWGMAPT